MTAPTRVRTRPSPSAPRDYHFPLFERRALSNGLRLIVATVPKLPIVTVAAIFDAGAICDPDGREGLAELAAKLLLEGTTTSDGAELIDRFERLGASVDASADWDSAVVTMTALSENLAPAFAILGEVLRMPAFREREVERLKSERLAELQQTSCSRAFSTSRRRGIRARMAATRTASSQSIGTTSARSSKRATSRALRRSSSPATSPPARRRISSRAHSAFGAVRHLAE